PVGSGECSGLKLVPASGFGPALAAHPGEHALLLVGRVRRRHIRVSRRTGRSRRRRRGSNEWLGALLTAVGDVFGPHLPVPVAQFVVPGGIWIPVRRSARVAHAFPLSNESETRTIVQSSAPTRAGCCSRRPP